MTSAGTTPGTGEVYPPLPEPDALTQFFWDGCNEGRLCILRCNQCGFYLHPPRVVCPKCLSPDLAPKQVSGRAVLDTWTIPLQPFDPYYQQHMPYVLAIVELPEQEDLKLTTNVVECAEEDLRMGMPLEVLFREVAPGVKLPLFRPAGSAGTDA